MAELVSTNAFFAKKRMTKGERRGFPGSGSILKRGAPRVILRTPVARRRKLSIFSEGFFRFRVGADHDL